MLGAGGQLDEHSSRLGPARRAGTRRRSPAAPGGRAARRTAAAPASTRRPTAGRRARRTRARAGRAAPGAARRRRTAAAAPPRCPSGRRQRCPIRLPAPAQLGEQPGQLLGVPSPSVTPGPAASSRPRRAVDHAQNAGARSASAHVPQPTAHPLRAAASLTSVVLPMPASPPTSTSRAAPAAASSTARSRRDSARARPTNATPGLCSAAASARTDRAEPRARFWRTGGRILAPRGRPVRRGAPMTVTFDPVRYKETTRAQWEDAAAAWHAWGPTLEDWLGEATTLMLDAAGRHRGQRRARRRRRRGRPDPRRGAPGRPGGARARHRHLARDPRLHRRGGRRGGPHHRRAPGSWTASGSTSTRPRSTP